MKPPLASRVMCQVLHGGTLRTQRTQAHRILLSPTAVRRRVHGVDSQQQSCTSLFLTKACQLVARRAHDGERRQQPPPQEKHLLCCGAVARRDCKAGGQDVAADVLVPDGEAAT